MKKLTVLAALGLASACASSQLPQAQVADTKAEIQAAETVGAKDNSRAALYLKLAQDQLEQAKEFADDGDEEEAKLLLDRAMVDAKLAIAVTKQAEAEAEAKEVLKEIDKLSQK